MSWVLRGGLLNFSFVFGVSESGGIICCDVFVNVGCVFFVEWGVCSFVYSVRKWVLSSFGYGYGF